MVMSARLGQIQLGACQRQRGLVPTLELQIQGATLGPGNVGFRKLPGSCQCVISQFSRLYGCIQFVKTHQQLRFSAWT